MRVNALEMIWVFRHYSVDLVRTIYKVKAVDKRTNDIFAMLNLGMQCVCNCNAWHIKQVVKKRSASVSIWNIQE